MEISAIAYARNGFADKFGIPRQSRADSVLETRIVFEDGYRDANMLRGIEGFSHLWLIWGFSEAISNKSKGSGSDKSGGNESGKDWSATVRPPRLGGNVRVGVLATRSPFRPNHLGLTSVRLLRIEDGDANHGEQGKVLVVQGADLMNGTPIYDIKPYITFSDAHPEAVSSYADEHKDDRLEVVGTEDPALIEILSQDPRPSYQDDPDRIYKLEYDGKHVEFRVVGKTVIVIQ